MKTYNYPLLKETLLQTTLSNGLNVFILPKKGFNKTYVTLSTPLGSTTTTVKKETGEMIELPSGIAHFLEHKLFDRLGEDLSITFAKNSAQVNAYTMNQRTTYLFSCTENLKQNISTLLDMVFHPIFTNEGVQKEIGIINQEIAMYKDDPSNSCYMELLQNMYHHLPLKEDVLGTETSIKEITAQLLKDVHETCYHPTKMLLFITGNVDAEDILLWLKKQTIHTEIPRSATKIKHPIMEPELPKNTFGTLKMEVSIPEVLIGIKLPKDELLSKNVIKWELVFSIFFDMLFGKSTRNYQTMLQKGIINNSFGLDITIEQDYGHILIGCNTRKHHEFIHSIQYILSDISTDDFSTEHFLRIKKQVVGRFIQSLNSLEFIANSFTKYYFLNQQLFDVLTIAKNISIKDLEYLTKFVTNTSKISTFIILPKSS
jgi:predicted Zn-dependent peptidase